METPRTRKTSYMSMEGSFFPKYQGIKFGITALICQIVFLVLFVTLVDYGYDVDARKNGNATGKLKTGDLKSVNDNSLHSNYPFFQDVQNMMFLGFGFLMTFLRRYGASSVGLNFFLCGLIIQWAILVIGFFHLKNGKILIDNSSLLGAEFALATILISFGALLGKLSPLQILIFAMLEIPVFMINEYIGRYLLYAVDAGDSIFVHTFGAYFGIACSRLICTDAVLASHKGEANYNSDIFAMIGTTLLWVYWPSFNGGTAVGDAQHRAVVNTVLSLCASVVMTFVVSSFLTAPEGEGGNGPRGRFHMVYVQNATLAGGVAVGASADMMIQPWGAILIGCTAGSISVLGYRYFTPLLNRLKFHDTCGVNNLHGMPGILGGIISAVAAALASWELYGNEIYQIFPARAPNLNTTFHYTVRFGGVSDVEPHHGHDRNASTQAVFQLAALGVTFLLACISGALVGLLLRLPFFDAPEEDDLYDDEKFWILPEEHPHEVAMSNIKTPQDDIPLTNVSTGDANNSKPASNSLTS